MNKKQKRMLVRILCAAVMLVALHFIPATGILRLGLYLIPYLVIGYDILIKAGKGIKNGQIFDENFLMAIATVGAIVLAVYDQSGDYTEAIAVMLFYQVGELFQSYAVGKSRRNISDLMDIRPDYANIERDGTLEKVDPDEVGIGSIIVVQPGEKVPIDGVVVQGESSLNTSALTGESLPREVKEGDEIVSGCINMSGVLKIQTTKEFGESTVSKILDLVENASSRKAQLGSLYIPICQILHTRRLPLRFGAGHFSAAGTAAGAGHGGRVGRLDLPCSDLPGDQLPLRAGDQHSTELFCRYRRREQRGNPGQGLQLSGDAVQYQGGGV